MAPSDLPLTELTHLNYAFAYIDPATYQLVTMDPDTPESLFQLTADTKQYNANLKVWISVGGWTFSDNDTATQPLFGEIAASATNRQTFADNVVLFLNRYGFDGIDLDWEYPGAPDRGGNTADTDNYVSLLQTLRSTFDASPRQLGISFTTPSSYWYLRWFDLPNMLKYADWTNLMSYDLHGTWDRNNPIGSIVQGHTNLTEIKLAVELFWRVGIQPSQISMGYGFYGRSFQLADPSCSTPGCQFIGGATAGPCSATSGILYYYEIMAILDQVPGLTPVHDETAAVKYLVFGTDQWVSYDDATTFKQKIDWANSVGIGGSLVWAADTDDDKYSAMAGLVGKSVSHVDLSIKAFSQTPVTVAQSLVGQNGQDCKRQTGCVDPTVQRCPDGQHAAGYDQLDCGDGYGKLICCPTATSPQSCTWRGSGGDCNGQCHPGEATLFGSSRGGGWESESSPKSKCSRGIKVFCCDAGDWKDVIAGCHWTGCGGSCSSSTETELARAHDGCTIFHPWKSYCCPKDTALHDCIWRGTPGDCADAKCQANEVSIASEKQGDSFSGCSWGRKRTNCCQVSKPPPPTLYCDITTCDIDPGACAISATDGFGSFKRDVTDQSNELEKRGPGRDYSWKLTSGYVMYQLSRQYATPTQYMAYVRSQLSGIATRWWQMRSRSCGTPSLTQVDFGTTAPTGGQVEHPVPMMLLTRFSASANWGRLPRPVAVVYGRNQVPDGPATRTPAIRDAFWQNVWDNAQGLPAGLPPVAAGSPDLRRPWERLYERFGSLTNPSHFVILRDAVNAIKGQLECFIRPMSPTRMQGYVQDAVNGDESAIESFMAPLRETVAMFEYVRDPLIVTRMDSVAAGIYQDLQLIELNTQGGSGLSAHWNEFCNCADPYYFGQVSQFSRTWVADQIRYIRLQFQASTSPYRDSVLKDLLDIENQIPNMKYAFED
ncbi:hypothetical protein ACEPPN_000250 [Leptodophora sp. 'Broadleaf-Isolate-01']